MADQRTISRRTLIRTGMTGLVGLVGLELLAACAPGAPIAPTNAPAPGAPPAPTAATTAAQGQPATNAQPAAQVPPAADGGDLVGTLEGPEVITDPAQFPKAFQEAPRLAQLVQSGQLPTVAERIGQDPLVLKPVHEIGTYGGTLRRVFTGPADQWSGARTAGHDNVLWWDYAWTKLVPNIARGWDMAADSRSLTLHLRRGMKWSDGHPFTADDFLFWFEELYQNKDLYPNSAPSMTINTKPIALDKIDESTVRYTFPDPYYAFPQVLASGQAPGAGEAQYGRTIESGYAPAHYLKQFLPNHTPQAQLDQLAKDAHVDTWTQLLALKNDWALNPDLPVVTAWRTVQPSNTNTWTFERNPFSIWVDTAGNQLPYIDTLQFTLAQNLEAANLQAITGAVDYQERHMDLTKVPVFLQNQQKNGYKLYLDPAPNGGDSPLSFNLSYDKDPEIARWFATTDFRRALSLGVDRDQLNQTFWLGLGTPGSVAPAESTRYSPGPEYRTLWSTFDPNKANQMLDALGLDKKGSDGLRLRSDGAGPLRLQVMTFAGQFLQFTKICEMVVEQWKKIGIDLQVQEVERGLGLTRVRNNDFQMWAWANDTSEDLFTTIHVVPTTVETGRSPMYGLWFITNGAKGKEPPPMVKQAMDMFRKGPGVPDDERTALGKDIWKIALDEVWHIGTVGLSPAMSGVRVAKITMGNVPARQFNSNIVRTPGGSRPETFFWKA